MSSPTASRFQQNLGRRGYAHYHAVWTVGAIDDLNNDIVLDLEEVSGKLSNTRFAVESIEWAASASGVSAVVEFDSMPPGADGLIVAIPPDGQAGEMDFSGYPSGCLPDPNRDSPGNVVVTTTGANQGDELFLAIKFKEKGQSLP